MRGWFRTLGLLLGLTLAGPADAAVVSARVRWQPSATTGVLGYRVYARVSGGAWGAPIDAGLPTPATDGSMSAVVSNLDATVAHGFAVSAYKAGGFESALSNELTLVAQATTTTTTTIRATTTTTRPAATTTTTTRPTTTRPTGSTTSTSTTIVGETTTTTLPDACAVDQDCPATDACHTVACRSGACVVAAVECPGSGSCMPGVCDPEQGCSVQQRPDGSVCDGGDPCVGGTCSSGVCIMQSAGPTRVRDSHFLSVSRFVLKAAGRSRRMVAGASFAQTDAVDPTVSGGTIELRSAAGDVLYRATLPPEAFRANKRHTAFKLIPKVARAVSGGVTKLVLRSDGRTADVVASGLTPELEPAAAQRALTWGLRFGEACVRALDLTCEQNPVATVCR